MSGAYENLTGAVELPAIELKPLEPGLDRSVNCPFYGRYMYRPEPSAGAPVPFVLVAQHGNQCALVINKYAPCYLDTADLRGVIDWRECSRVRDLRL